MPAGLSGHLLSASFLERRLAEAGDGLVDHGARRRFAVARQAADTLGPSSSLRAVLEAGAAPLVGVLGFEAPQDLDRVDSVLAATVAAPTGCLALLVKCWGEPLDVPPHTLAKQALLRSSRWNAIFNGTDLRLVEDVERKLAGSPSRVQLQRRGTDHAREM